LVNGGATVAARPQAAAPFGLELHTETGGWPAVLEALTEAGARRAGPTALEIARILAGWPRLGAEIDEKTLPQEVRFDDLDGVSYTKGCYTGQETVARVHFRGHVNRVMAGLWWTAPPNLRAAPTVVAEDRMVGRVTSVAWVPPFERFIGLAKIRREANRRGRVIAFRATAHIVPLPFPEMI
jgi:folate-binding protein YgfZ